MSFDTNLYDGHTLEPALEQYERLNGKRPPKVIADLGYRGKKQIGETQIVTPDRFKKNITKYQKQKHKQDMGRRSSIEPIIGHVKQDHGLGRNYLKDLM
jgi:IS5 family transposase